MLPGCNVNLGFFQFYSFFFIILYFSGTGRHFVPSSFLISPCQPNMIITLRNEGKSEASSGSGQAEMDEAGGAGAPVRRLECSLLLKDGEIIVDGLECVPFLSQGSSYSARILRQEGGRAVCCCFFRPSLGAACACSPGAECTSKAGRWLRVPGRYRHLCTVAAYQNMIN